MKTITLTKGKVALVDDNLFEELKLLHWYSHSMGYAVRGIYNPTKKRNDFEMMQNYIMKPPKGFWVDHINRNRLDNRKENLRICTASQNGQNKEQDRGNSGYRGVSYKNDQKRNKAWRAYIKKNGKQIFIGHFTSPKEAAKAYDKKAKEIFGQFARLNFT